MFIEGQGVLGQIKFADGMIPTYKRFYLVVKVNENDIQILNISSTKGKEQKLLMPFNENIINYNPPFNQPSFIKLDSLVTVPSCDWNQLKILKNGNTLDSTELNKIINSIKKS